MRSSAQAKREYDRLVVVADGDRARCDAVRAQLEAVPSDDPDDPGAAARARYRVQKAHDCEAALRLVSPDVSALVCDLDTGRGKAVKLISQLRSARPDLAILCYRTATPRAEAVAAMMAGADHYVEYGDGGTVAHALDLALDRRWLAQLIERSAADLEEARRRMARLGSGSSVVLPGLRPPPAANAVMPFHEAVRRYLEACVKLFDGDPKGLADRLGMSYFALRRLLKRYDVPFPGRTQSGRSAGRPTRKR